MAIQLTCMEGLLPRGCIPDTFPMSNTANFPTDCTGLRQQGHQEPGSIALQAAEDQLQGGKRQTSRSLQPGGALLVALAQDKRSPSGRQGGIGYAACSATWWTEEEGAQDKAQTGVPCHLVEGWGGGFCGSAINPCSPPPGPLSPPQWGRTNLLRQDAGPLRPHSGLWRNSACTRKG